MEDNYDWEIYEMFSDQLESQIALLEHEISLLEDSTTAKEALDELFRKFHTYKSSSAYLYLTPLNDLVSKAEIVLSAIREKKTPVSISVIDWLYKVKKQLQVYIEEMQDKKRDLSPIASNILQKIQITKEYIDLKKTLKTLSLLYMDRSKKRASKLLPFFQKYTKSVVHSTEEDAANTVYSLKEYDIVIINLEKENYQTIDFVQTNYPHLPIIVVFDKISSVTESRLVAKGITHSITNPLNAKVLYSELLSIVKAHHASSNVLLEHTKINKYVEALKPLPNTILEVIRICDDKESSIRDLIQTVKSDPTLSLSILKLANSPIYGSIHLKTIDQAVSKFGKSAIKALTLSNLANSLGDVDLEPYSMNEQQFSDVAMIRLSLMLKWYAKISIADLSLLSATAILGNIGQLLLAKELINSELNQNFRELYHVFDIKYAEESILNTTTSYVSAQILRHFKLQTEIVEIIEHSDSPLNAPKELQKLCVANYIVSSHIDLQGNIADNILPNSLSLMNQFNLKPEIFQKALAAIKESK